MRKFWLSAWIIWMQPSASSRARGDGSFLCAFRYSCHHCCSAPCIGRKAYRTVSKGEITVQYLCGTCHKCTLKKHFRAQAYQWQKGRIRFMSHDCEATELIPTGKKKFTAFIATSMLLSPGVLEDLAQQDVNTVWASQNYRDTNDYYL